VIPVARKVWQPILVLIPAAFALRCTIPKASCGRVTSGKPLRLAVEARNKGLLGSALIHRIAAYIPLFATVAKRIPPSIGLFFHAFLKTIIQ
jgi:hypothetical protein